MQIPMKSRKLQIRNRLFPVEKAIARIKRQTEKEREINLQNRQNKSFQEGNLGSRGNYRLHNGGGIIFTRNFNFIDSQICPFLSSNSIISSYLNISTVSMLVEMRKVNRYLAISGSKQRLFYFSFVMIQNKGGRRAGNN